MLRALRQNGPAVSLQANWLSPGERGLDDLQVEKENDHSLLAFLHLSERAAATRFAVYHDVLAIDPETRAVFGEILKDEAFHMNYTHKQLKRIEPRRYATRLWLARMSRMWKAYLRLSVAVAGVFGAVFLLVQYFVLLPVFAFLAKRAARSEPEGWTAADARPHSMRSQYR
ncbi:hypothetical protein LZC95_37990 [Pendulispora brunnea]|uniref:Uncharacterized protein n=1 Tax=Pendulispora brunnea TaxID=2905690 RepID=A0ABZ2K0H3_9BACT